MPAEVPNFSVFVGYCVQYLQEVLAAPAGVPQVLMGRFDWFVFAGHRIKVTLMLTGMEFMCLSVYSAQLKARELWQNPFNCWWGLPRIKIGALTCNVER